MRLEDEHSHFFFPEVYATSTLLVCEPRMHRPAIIRLGRNSSEGAYMKYTNTRKGENLQD